MRLSAHFTLDEGIASQEAARNGIDNRPSEDALKNMMAAALGMEQVRAILNDTPIIVSSWFRCAALERRIGGSGSPRGHSSGYCIDFIAPGFDTPLEICRRIVESGLKFDQLIYEGTWVHISFHPAMRQNVFTAHFAPGVPTRYTPGLP